MDVDPPPPPPTTARPAGVPVARAADPLLLRGLGPWTALAFALLVAGVTLAMLLLPTLLQGDGLREPTDLADLPLLPLIVDKAVSLLIAAALALALTRAARARLAALGWRLNGLGWQLLSVPAIIVTVYAALFAVVIAAAPFMFDQLPSAAGQPGEPNSAATQPTSFEREVAQRFQFVSAFADHPATGLALLFLLVAAHEELVFRGMLLPYLRRATGSWVAAVLLSSAFFGALHVPMQGWLAGVMITGVGAVFAVCFIATRSLIAVTLAHAAFNFAQTYLSRVFRDMPEMQELLERTAG